MNEQIKNKNVQISLNSKKIISFFFVINKIYKFFYCRLQKLKTFFYLKLRKFICL